MARDDDWLPRTSIGQDGHEEGDVCRADSIGGANYYIGRTDRYHVAVPRRQAVRRDENLVTAAINVRRLNGEICKAANHGIFTRWKESGRGGRSRRRATEHDR